MNFLLYLCATTQVIFVIVVFGGGSIAGLCLVRWLVSAGPSAEEPRGSGSDVRSAGRILRLGPCLRDRGRVGSASRRPNAYALTEATALESLYKLGEAFLPSRCAHQARFGPSSITRNA